MASKSKKRRERRKRLRALISDGVRPCPPANQGVRPPPLHPDCLFDWADANHIDLGQLRAAIESGQLPPDEKLDAIQEQLVALIVDKAMPISLRFQVIDVIIACERADLVQLREGLRSLSPEELAEVFQGVTMNEVLAAILP